MENSKFSLKNFRVFGDKGAEFEIAPITVLTGCNSSGKSSVIKSLMLLNDYFLKLIEDYTLGRPFDISKYELVFNKGKHNLGSFKKAVSEYCLNDKKEMIFRWKRFSPLYFGDLDIEMIFALKEKGILDNACLKMISIKDKEVALIDIYIDNKISYNFNIRQIKESFFDFAERVNYYQKLVDALGVEDIFIPHPDRFNSKEDLENSEYGIDNNLVNSIVYAQQSLFERNGCKKLISLCKEINIKHRSLFYLPVLDLLKGIKKENISEILWQRVEAVDKYLEGLKDNEIEKLMMKINHEILQKMVNEFIQSEYEFFDQFYLDKENEVLHKQSSVIRSSKRDLQSFMEEIENNEDLPRIDYNHPEYFLGRKVDSYNKIYSDELFISYMNLIRLFADDSHFKKNRFVEDWTIGIQFNYLPKEFIAARQYAIALLQDVLFNSQSFIGNIDFVEAVRANVQRVYTYNNSTIDFNESLLRYIKFDGFNKEDHAIRGDRYQLGTFMRKWLSRFEIADDIIFKNADEGLGILIYLVKGGKSELLADKGYGITQLLAVLIKIEMVILQNQFVFEHPLVYGKTFQYKESTICIEEPETNLHPKFQSLLAEMFMDAYKTYNIRFIVETHSEYLIRKLQTLVAKKEITPNDVALHYIYDHDPKKRPAGKPQVLKIDIKEDGRLSDSFGTGFFDEADNLAMDLLTLKSLN